MDDSQGELQYRARKTPGPEHPKSPPAVSSAIEVLFLTIDRDLVEEKTATFRDRIVTSQVLYQPGILAVARALFEGTKWSVHHEREIHKVIPFPPTPRLADWDHTLLDSWNMKHASSDSEGTAFYCFDETYDFSASRFETLQEEFINYLIAGEVLKIVHHPILNIRREFDETEESFSVRCLEKAREDMENDLKNLEETLSRLKTRLTERLDREVRELGPENLEPNLRNEPRTDNSISDRKTDHHAEMELRQGLATIDEIKKELEELETVRKEKLRQFDENVTALAQERQADIVRLNRGNLQILRFSLVWLPYLEFILQEEDHRHPELIRAF